ncbi:homing endonuclease associated repeat-containing protein [Halapricum salinum]|uniref:homing endonuclease associated repeat-containing protein n=1 Tax=Halapricum salinum TaxID=1457250 RepID=UPI0010A587B2|nr:hypothetical protein [Halapricum salinum]
MTSPDFDAQKRDLVIELVALVQQFDRLLTAAEINEHAEYSHQDYRDAFGDLFQAYQSAGILPEEATRRDLPELLQTGSPTKGDENTTVGSAHGNEEETTRDEMIAELNQIFADKGKLPYPSDLRHGSRFTHADYQDEFGTWNEALAAAGINKRTELLTELQRVKDELGELPTQSEMNDLGAYSATMYAQFFGSWSEAKEEVSKANNTSSIDPTASGSGTPSESDNDAKSGSSDELGQVSSSVAYRLRKAIEEDKI